MKIASLSDVKYMVNLYNANLLFVAYLHGLLQRRAKSFLSAVYNEWFLYDSLLASQPSMNSAVTVIRKESFFSLHK